MAARRPHRCADPDPRPGRRRGGVLVLIAALLGGCTDPDDLLSGADLRVQLVGAHEPLRMIEVEVELAEENLVRRAEARGEVVIYFPVLPEPGVGFGIYVRAFDDRGDLKKCVWRAGAYPGDRVRIDLTRADPHCFPPASPDSGPDAESPADAADADPGPPGRGPPDSSMGRGPDKRR